MAKLRGAVCTKVMHGPKHVELHAIIELVYAIAGAIRESERNKARLVSPVHVYMHPPRIEAAISPVVGHVRSLLRSEVATTVANMRKVGIIRCSPPRSTIDVCAVVMCWATAVVAAAVVATAVDGVAIGGDQAIEVGATARSHF